MSTSERANFIGAHAVASDRLSVPSCRFNALLAAAFQRSDAKA
jgi:hypothetical protein